MKSFLNNNDEKNIKLKIFIFIFCLLFLKIIIASLYGDTENSIFSQDESNEWGRLYLTLKNNGTPSWFSNGQVDYPNGFMPPLYPYIIYLFSFVSEGNLVKLVLSFQIFLSILTSIILFKMCLKKNFNFSKSFIIMAVFSLFPLNLYATTQVSSATVVLFLYIFFMYNIISGKNFIIISIVAAFGILARGEFLYVYLIFFVFLILKSHIKIKDIILGFFVCIVILSPQLKRNFLIFDRLFITQSSGYVLWRGNNSLSTVTSIRSDQTLTTLESIILKNKLDNIYDLDGIYNTEIEIYKKNNEYSSIINQLNQIKDNNKYDVLRDDIFKKQAFQNIFNDPLRYAWLHIKKILSFIFFNLKSDYPKYYHPLSIIPEFILSIGAVIGLILSIKNYKNFLEIYLYMFTIIGLYSLLLILPRYKLFLLPYYSIFFSIFVFKVKDYLKNKIFN